VFPGSADWRECLRRSDSCNPECADLWNQKEFAQARSILAAIESRVSAASPKAQLRYHLELDRTYASATHAAPELTPPNLKKARTHYLTAVDEAQSAALDYLAIDALHMMPFIDTDPTLPLKWKRPGHRLRKANITAGRQTLGSFTAQQRRLC